MYLEPLARLTKGNTNVSLLWLLFWNLVVYGERLEQEGRANRHIFSNQSGDGGFGLSSWQSQMW